MTDPEGTNATTPRVRVRPSRPRWRIRTGLWRVLAAGFGLAVIVGLIWPVVWGEAGRDGPGPTTLAASTKASSVLRVDVARPVLGGVRRLTIQPGSVHAFESVDLFAKASGFLNTQQVDIGSSIKRGEPLAEIDAPELLADRDEAEAAVEQAKAKEDQAVRGVATAESERSAARGRRHSGRNWHCAAGRPALTRHGSSLTGSRIFTPVKQSTPSSSTSTNKSWTRPLPPSGRCTRRSKQLAPR